MCSNFKASEEAVPTVEDENNNIRIYDVLYFSVPFLHFEERPDGIHRNHL